MARIIIDGVVMNAATSQRKAAAKKSLAALACMLYFVELDILRSLFLIVLTPKPFPQIPCSQAFEA